MDDEGWKDALEEALKDNSRHIRSYNVLHERAEKQKAEIEVTRDMLDGCGSLFFSVLAGIRAKAGGTWTITQYRTHARNVLTNERYLLPANIHQMLIDYKTRWNDGWEKEVDPFSFDLEIQE